MNDVACKLGIEMCFAGGESFVLMSEMYCEANQHIQKKKVSFPIVLVGNPGGQGGRLLLNPKFTQILNLDLFI